MHSQSGFRRRLRGNESAQALRMKVVVITGPSSGIGKHCAAFVAQEVGCEIRVGGEAKDLIERSLVKDITATGAPLSVFRPIVTQRG